MFDSFLEYSKYILDKVSFDVKLLQKEYQKAISNLKVEEVLQLNSWIKNKGLQLSPISLTP